MELNENPPCGGSSERLSLGSDFSLLGVPVPFQEQLGRLKRPESPGVTIPFKIILMCLD